MIAAVQHTPIACLCKDHFEMPWGSRFVRICSRPRLQPEIHGYAPVPPSKGFFVVNDRAPVMFRPTHEEMRHATQGTDSGVYRVTEGVGSAREWPLEGLLDWKAAMDSDQLRSPEM